MCDLGQCVVVLNAGIANLNVLIIAIKPNVRMIVCGGIGSILPLITVPSVSNKILANAGDTS